MNVICGHCFLTNHYQCTCKMFFLKFSSSLNLCLCICRLVYCLSSTHVMRMPLLCVCICSIFRSPSHPWMPPDGHFQLFLFSQHCSRTEVCRTDSFIAGDALHMRRHLWNVWSCVCMSHNMLTAVHTMLSLFGSQDGEPPGAVTPTRRCSSSSTTTTTSSGFGWLSNIVLLFSSVSKHLPAALHVSAILVLLTPIARHDSNSVSNRNTLWFFLYLLCLRYFSGSHINYSVGPEKQLPWEVDCGFPRNRSPVSQNLSLSLKIDCERSCNTCLLVIRMFVFCTG